jgi:PhnB protein
MAKKKTSTAKKTGAARRPARPVAKRPSSKRPARKGAPAARKAARPAVLKDGRPGRMWWPALAPYLTVRDGQASLEFYARAFGFEAYGEVMRDAEGRVQHAGMRVGEAAIMFGPEEDSLGLRPPAGGPDSLSLYVYLPDVDALHARAQRGGATVVRPLTDQFWGDRTVVLKDRDGYHWTFATHLGRDG